MDKEKFICTMVLSEMVILSDGRITSCCMDPAGNNTFANIYQDNFAEVLKKLRLFKQKLATDPTQVPECLHCFNSRRRIVKGEAFYDYFLHENPSAEEIDKYLNLDIAPKGLIIELTTACNLTCVGCSTGVRNTKRAQHQKVEKSRFIDIDKFKTWITPYLEKLEMIKLFNYGETFLHPGAIEFCSFVTAMNPDINLIIATNLLPLNSPAKIKELVLAQPDMLVVSVHGASQESVEKYMGPHADFNLALALMKKIIAQRNQLGLVLPVIIWKYILFSWNDSAEEMNQAKTLAAENNIDYLGFEVTGGEIASPRFNVASNDFADLKKTDVYIGNIYAKLFSRRIKKSINKNVTVIAL